MPINVGLAQARPNNRFLNAHCVEQVQAIMAESQRIGAFVASTRQSKDDMVANYADKRRAAVQHADSLGTTLPTERTSTTVYYRNDIEELRAALFEIGSIQREESCETYVPVICCGDVNGATGRKPSLCKAQEIGEKKLRVLVFPLFSTHGREVWSYVMFLFTLGLVTRSAVSLALPSFVDDSDKARATVTAVDYVDLGLSSVSWVLAFLDLVVIVYLHRCRLARDACKKCSGAEDDAEMQPLIPQQGTATDEGYTCCCFSMLRRYADLLRMVVYDILVYSVTICSMFRMIWSILQDRESDTFNDHDTVIQVRSISIFASQTLLSVITIYGIRIFVIARIIFLIQKARKNGPMENSGRRFHIHFFIHVIGQMVSQVVTVVFIGVRFYYENSTGNTDSTVKISLSLWYIIVSGLVIPFLGIFTYKIGNYYSVKEYSIGFFFDLLLNNERSVENAQNKKGEPSLGFKSIHLGMSSEEERIAKSIAQKSLRNFKIYRINCLCEYFYVFMKPLLILLSVLYAILLIAFIACIAIWISYSIRWVIFFVIGITLICLANIRVLLVGGVSLACLKCLCCYHLCSSLNKD